MRILVLPASICALAVLCAPLPVAAAAAGAFTQIDTLLNECRVAVKTQQECWARSEILRKDLAKKESELRAEFNGRIPASFDDLITIKRKRADKQREACAKTDTRPAELFQEADMLLKGFEPKSMPGIIQRRASLLAESSRYTRLFNLNYANPKQSR